MRLHNAAPPGEVDEVAGTRQPDLPSGTYQALVTVYLPAATVDLQATGGAVLLVGEDGPMRVIGIRVDIPRTRSRELVLRFWLPKGKRSVTLLPAGRASPSVVRLGDARLSDAHRQVLRW
jgi:hypothetical protein